MKNTINGQQLTIRYATIHDTATLSHLIKHYLQFYHTAKVPSQAKLKTFIETICKNLTLGCFLLAELNGKAVGFASLYKIFSTFQAHQGLILNDLYVLPEYRKFGIGSQLFNECQKIYTNEKYAYMEWMTASDNDNAINFYLKKSAKKTDWIVFTL